MSDVHQMNKMKWPDMVINVYKKVLLRERKRYTARRIASTRCAGGGEGYPFPGGGYPFPGGGTPPRRGVNGQTPVKILPSPSNSSTTFCLLFSLQSKTTSVWPMLFLVQSCIALQCSFKQSPLRITDGDSTEYIPITSVERKSKRTKVTLPVPAGSVSSSFFCHQRGQSLSHECCKANECTLAYGYNGI